MYKGILGCLKRERKIYWHLVGRGRGQRCCLTFYSTQNNPTTETHSAKNVNRAVTEKPWNRM